MSETMQHVFQPLACYPNEAEIGGIIRESVDMISGTDPRFVLQCSVGALAQRIAVALSAAPLAAPSETTKASDCAHDWTPIAGGEVCYGCNQIRRYDSVTYTAPVPFAAPLAAERGDTDKAKRIRGILARIIGNHTDRGELIHAMGGTYQTYGDLVDALPDALLASRPQAGTGQSDDRESQLGRALDWCARHGHSLLCYPTGDADAPYKFVLGDAPASTDVLQAINNARFDYSEPLPMVSASASHPPAAPRGVTEATKVMEDAAYAEMRRHQDNDGNFPGLVSEAHERAFIAAILTAALTSEGA